VRDAKGGPKDIKRAVDLFGIACKADIHTACVDLGLLLYKGELLKKASPERAVELFTNECARVDVANLPAEGPHDLAYGCDALGLAYEEGKGTDPAKPDLEKAATLYTQACEARYAPGLCVGRPARRGEEEPSDYAIAAALYDQACKLDARMGCMELATLHATKAWPEANDADAASTTRRPATSIRRRGCFEAGQLMESGRIAAGEGEIESLYSLACEHGHTEACAQAQPRVTVSGQVCAPGGTTRSRP
jgi:TPR repeat protein